MTMNRPAAQTGAAQNQRLDDLFPAAMPTSRTPANRFRTAVAPNDQTAYVPWRMTGTNTGSFDPPGYAPTGRPLDLRGIDVMQFHNGLIYRYEAVYNYSDVARQLGLTLPRNGRLERLAVTAQRLFVRARQTRCSAT